MTSKILAMADKQVGSHNPQLREVARRVLNSSPPPRHEIYKWDLLVDMKERERLGINFNRSLTLSLASRWDIVEHLRMEFLKELIALDEHLADEANKFSRNLLNVILDRTKRLNVASRIEQMGGLLMRITFYRTVLKAKISEIYKCSTFITQCADVMGFSNPLQVIEKYATLQYALNEIEEEQEERVALLSYLQEVEVELQKQAVEDSIVLHNTMAQLHCRLKELNTETAELETFIAEREKQEAESRVNGWKIKEAIHHCYNCVTHYRGLEVRTSDPYKQIEEINIRMNNTQEALKMVEMLERAKYERRPTMMPETVPRSSGRYSKDQRASTAEQGERASIVERDDDAEGKVKYNNRISEQDGYRDVNNAQTCETGSLNFVDTTQADCRSQPRGLSDGQSQVQKGLSKAGETKEIIRKNSNALYPTASVMFPCGTRNRSLQHESPRQANGRGMRLPRRARSFGPQVGTGFSSMKEDLKFQVEKTGTATSSLRSTASIKLPSVFSAGQTPFKSLDQSHNKPDEQIATSYYRGMRLSRQNPMHSLTSDTGTLPGVSRSRVRCRRKDSASLDWRAAGNAAAYSLSNSVSESCGSLGVASRVSQRVIRRIGNTHRLYYLSPSVTKANASADNTTPEIDLGQKEKDKKDVHMPELSHNPGKNESTGGTLSEEIANLEDPYGENCELEVSLEAELTDSVPVRDRFGAHSVHSPLTFRTALKKTSSATEQVEMEEIQFLQKTAENEVSRPAKLQEQRKKPMVKQEQLKSCLTGRAKLDPQMASAAPSATRTKMKCVRYQPYQLPTRKSDGHVQHQWQVSTPDTTLVNSWEFVPKKFPTHGENQKKSFHPIRHKRFTQQECLSLLASVKLGPRR